MKFSGTMKPSHCSYGSLENLENSATLPNTMDQRKKNQKLSWRWRMFHGLSYATGGALFFIGSFCYYPYGNMAAGGWIFVIGGATFFYCDTMEWWKNRRGCVNIYYDEEYMWDQEDAAAVDKLEMAENGLNFSLSVFGSFLYFLGAFFFLPPYSYMQDGIWIFIAGSAVIMISQIWKIYRHLYSPKKEEQTKEFDWDGMTVDALAGLGGTSYFFGSIFFLPWLDTDNAATILAANWFVFGGFFYALSGVFLIMRYFCHDPLVYPNYDSDGEIKLTPHQLFRSGSDDKLKSTDRCSPVKNESKTSAATTAVSYDYNDNEEKKEEDVENIVFSDLDTESTVPSVSSTFELSQ